MDYFEGIIKTLLEQDGYWVRQSFKVNLTKQEKKDVGKPSLPRPEIDLLAYKPSVHQLLALEAKSYLDSPGVNVDDLMIEYKQPEGRYKLFTCTTYRETIVDRLRQDLQETGMIQSDVTVTLGLVAGNVAQGKGEVLRSYMTSKGWFFWSPEDIRAKVLALSEKGYENDPSIITAKILSR